MFGIVHNEDPAHIEFNAMTTFPVPQIERCPGRNIEQRGVLVFTFYAVMNIGNGILKVMSDMFVEFLVFFIFDFALGSLVVA